MSLVKNRTRLFAVLGACLLVVIVLSIMSVAGALTLPVIGGGSNGVNDLAALGQGLGQTPQRVPIAQRAEPPLTATPLAGCGPGSRPEASVDGRVPAGSATDGLWCNAQMIAHQGTSGGFKALRYVDRSGMSAPSTTPPCCSRPTRSTPRERHWGSRLRR